MNYKYDVFGIGNALVDTLAVVSDDVLEKLNISKGTMTLVEEEVQQKLMHELSEHNLEMKSGGSAANTMHGVALCGGKAIYSGKVADDKLGKFYKIDLENNKIEFAVAASKQKNGSTGSCLVLTTDDAERSMLTHLGISTSLVTDDIPLNKIALSKMIYVEGYLWDGEEQKQACLSAMKEAKKNNVKVSMTFSDPFCVDRFKDEFLSLAKNELDLVFCNIEEAKHLSSKDDKDEAIDFFRENIKAAFITDGAHGAIVIENGQATIIEGFPAKPIDTNGAGDGFAAGVIYGLTHNYDANKSAKIGNYIASKIVCILGPRLEKQDLGEFESFLQSLV